MNPEQIDRTPTVFADLAAPASALVNGGDMEKDDRSFYSIESAIDGALAIFVELKTTDTNIIVAMPLEAIEKLIAQFKATQ